MVRPGRHLGVVLLRLASAYAHVPTYGEGADGCFHPPHPHTTSQAIYVHGSGGLQIHLESQTDPFDIAGGEIIDVDAVFKHAYDQTTYDLYIGCGGCVWSTDELVEPRLALAGYQPAEVEPFTQTAYRSLFAKEDRKYDTSALASCTEHHFSIRLIDYHNRTEEGHETLVWGAVIGLSEAFTVIELLSFPLYILRNHGDTWNGLGWTWWVVLPGTLLGYWLGRYLVRRVLGWKWLSPFDRQMLLEPRAWLCEFAIVSFLAVCIEITAHLVYAQIGIALGAQFWVGLIGVAWFANGLPILVQCLVFWGLYHRDDKWAIASTHWWPLELAAGVGWLYLFGAGFYIGPAFVILDAFFSAYERSMGWSAPRLDELMGQAGFPPQYETKDEEKRPLRGARVVKRVRIRDDSFNQASGRDTVPSVFF